MVLKKFPREATRPYVVQRRRLMEIRAQAERCSGIGLKLFGFLAESLFTFIPEFRVHPGTAFGIIPESRSLSPGFPQIAREVRIGEFRLLLRRLLLFVQQLVSSWFLRYSGTVWVGLRLSSLVMCMTLPDWSFRTILGWSLG